MKLSVFLRKKEKKSELTQIRREGNIPAVLYGPNRSLQSVFIEGDLFHAGLRKLKSGLLATTLFELHEGSNIYKAIVKEVQYHPVTYAIEHLDFYVVDETAPFKVNVPIQIVGTADCVGVKLGGFMRQVIRSLKVSCLLKDLPDQFVLNVAGLGVGESMRLSHVALPERVKPLAKMNEIAVVIAKKA